jgi:hypothetical protein
MIDILTAGTDRLLAKWKRQEVSRIYECYDIADFIDNVGLDDSTAIEIFKAFSDDGFSMATCGLLVKHHKEVVEEADREANCMLGFDEQKELADMRFNAEYRREF